MTFWTLDAIKIEYNTKSNEWYYVDKEEFKSSKEVLVEFYKLYSDKSH